MATVGVKELTALCLRGIKNIILGKNNIILVKKIRSK